MSSYWYILIGLALIYYGYVSWVLLKKKRTSKKKDSDKFAYLHINNKFVNKSNNKQTDLGAVLDQIDEVEDTSKLLEAFKEGSLDDDSNSLTRKKHEKLKVIRNKDTAEEDPPDSET
ncbi:MULTISPECIES: hypothetical protein [Flavobacteriaceae]|jgi:hypothetical protein|uniref:Uncharacterized protein n=3 Tax=Flavobacteriaceae TaxID=49546 RepID=A0A223VAF3_9FLAO|nr:MULTISPECIES: hypothetical protein [Flavobacteriaceae]ASV32364.1 hypothetical protein CJ263_20205 [Maribacter cobaltidurans]MDC6388711.1 hypothetical protein [Maribacter sp. PR1]MEE1976100.1 hypothetical protein [Maribacter cobaltidurans]RIV68972.1 hypothetical protein D2U88_17575 [Allomuricauda aequoris]TXK00681.1 hypothetical protein FQ019_17370 [Allomuricauda aequoris]